MSELPRAGDLFEARLKVRFLSSPRRSLNPARPRAFLGRFPPLRSSVVRADDGTPLRIRPASRLEKTQTSIGKWKGIERAGVNTKQQRDGVDGDLILSGDTLVFEKGQKCWNGPSRSLRVALACGPEDVLSSVAEPETCTYTAVLETPAACSPALRDVLVASSRVGREEKAGDRGSRADAGVEGEL